MTYPPTVTPIDKIGDHLIINAGTPRAVAIPCASAVLTPDGSDTVITAPGGAVERVYGRTPAEILRVMYPPVTLATVDLPPMAEADWDLDLSGIEGEREPRIRPGSLPARVLDELYELDLATASIVAERIGGVAIASVSQALRSLCDRGLAERAKHPISGRYMYRATGSTPGMTANDQILAALRSSGEPMKSRQLIEAVPEYSPNTIYTTIRRAVKRGEIRKVLVGDPGYIAYEIADEEAGK